MMKLSKVALPIIIVIALLIAVYFLFMRPTGFTSPESVVESYIEGLNEEESGYKMLYYSTAYFIQILQCMKNIRKMVGVEGVEGFRGGRSIRAHARMPIPKRFYPPHPPRPPQHHV